MCTAASAWRRGGQLTLYRDASGAVVNVIGAHYPGLGPTDRASIPEPRSVPPLSGPADEVRLSDLMIHPDTGRRFYRVETRRFDSRWVEWIDAATGQVFNRYNALETNDGKGVKGDTKSMQGLTRLSGSDHSLYSADGRQKTLDALNCTNPFLCFLYDMLDADNHWLDERPNSPGQRAAVDAQFHANVVDDYYQTRHGFNWLTCTGLQAMKSVVHWQDKYNNAFWNGTYVVYGDGDQATTFRELSGGLDVAAHEYTHGVTGCTSKLDYQNEPGALNESFSDMMGSTVEFFADLLEDSTKCVKATGQTTCADWWIGEDITLFASAKPGFRNMADPAEDGDPDHYSERYTGTNDNGGVHSNSGIPNHAYWLAVNGGQNAGCARGHNHGTDCGITVAPIGLDKAEQVFFQAFIGLTATANMSNARDATIAKAKTLLTSCQAVLDAWQAVGVTGTNTCGEPPPTATPTPAPMATNTPVPPTATNTAVPPTATNTPGPPTATSPPVGNPNAMGVFSINWKVSSNRLTFTVNIRRDSDGGGSLTAADAPVRGASVSAELFWDPTPDGQCDPSADRCWSASDTTNKEGNVSLWIQNPPSGTYEAVVDGLTHSTYSWVKPLDRENPETFVVNK